MPRSPNACSSRFLRISAETRRSQALDARAPPAVRSLHLPGLRLSRVLPTRGALRRAGCATARRRIAAKARDITVPRHRCSAPESSRASGARRKGHGRSPGAGHHGASARRLQDAPLRSAPAPAGLTVLTPTPRSPLGRLSATGRVFDGDRKRTSARVVAFDLRLLRTLESVPRCRLKSDPGIMIRQLRTDSRPPFKTTSSYASPSAERPARSVVWCGFPPEIYDRHPAPLRHGAWSQVHLTVPTCPLCAATWFAKATPSDRRRLR